MDQLKHFTHQHLLSLVNVSTENHHNNDSENSDEEDEDDYVVQENHLGKCNMCEEDIYSFHLCYYDCNECTYSLHKFCADMPSLQNHQSHPDHNLTLTNNPYVFSYADDWMCDVCNIFRDKSFFRYHCSICQFNMDIICATVSEQKIVHPSHPHQLERMIKPIISKCHACGHDHKGIFYHCVTCFWFWIHLDCALLPAKLLIQQANDSFTHPHPLTLAYSFPYVDYDIKYKHRCRVCDSRFRYSLWLYKCDKCRYYAHVDCATSKKEPFMSIFLPTSLGKTSKNFQDHDHPNLLNCPFPDESYNLLKHTFSNQNEFMGKENDGEMINHSGHQHPLVLFKTLENKSVSLHDPMKKIQILCDGCVKPITMVPFYKCSQDSQQCNFILHTWCAMLPSEIRDHPGHPQHSVLSLITNIPSNLFDAFICRVCGLYCNGFAYGCTTCTYYIDINCAFIPQEITHEAHPNHLLSLVKFRSKQTLYCVACLLRFKWNVFMYHCQSCNFYLHASCALLLPKIVRHKYDKHPLTLKYHPAENHSSEYFCDICEYELIPLMWFYHCATCVASMHSGCTPVILQSEQAIPSGYDMHFVSPLFKFLNVKFGGKLEIGNHPHRFTFVQGMKCDGSCEVCNYGLQYERIFKCFECKFAFHDWCAFSYAKNIGMDIYKSSL